MALLVLTGADVARLLPMRTCMELVAEALGDLASGRLRQAPRTVFSPGSTTDLMALMPAHRRAPEAVYGLKALCAFPNNPARGLDSNQGAVLLFDGGSGEVVCVMNASAITALRTAAASGVATRLLAREDASVLAILGAGVQGRSHLEAMLCVRSIDKVRVWSRTYEHASAFAVRFSDQYSLQVEAMRSAEAAVRDADVIVTATTAVEPIIERSWIAPGTHVNAVGSADADRRELDSETIRSASIFVDHREAAWAEAGDLVIPLTEGVIDRDHLRAELGELLVGRARGRTTVDELTVFKSVGLAVEDLAAAEYLFRRAKETRSGSLVDF